MINRATSCMSVGVAAVTFATDVRLIVEQHNLHEKDVYISVLRGQLVRAHNIALWLDAEQFSTRA